jgi:hypothetical protein
VTKRRVYVVDQRQRDPTIGQLHEHNPPGSHGGSAMTDVLPVPATGPPEETPATGIGSSLSPVGIPQRCGKALLGWVHEPNVRPLFHVACVTSPLQIDDFVAEYRRRRALQPETSTAPDIASTVAMLPAALEAQATELRATDQFRTAYEPFGATFAVVSIANLITPQWWIDSEYVETLAASAPEEDDLDGMFKFSFAMGRLARPMQLGMNGAAFASTRSDIGGITPLRVARYSPEKVTFEFDVVPRPNWVWLAAWQGRLLITNGVHHLLALMKAGREHAICLIRPAESFADLQALGWNMPDPGLFRPNELMAPRPPLLRDYLDEQHAADVAIHLRECYLRLAIQVEPGVIPRVE